MDKDKLTEITENTMENSSENINDPEASVLFKKIFHEDGKALEEEALAHPFTVDEERKEALRRRILAAAVEENLILETSEDNRTSDKSDKRKKHRFSPLVRWAAVLALVCAGVFGVSMTSQAKGSGLWNSIQRLIGGETRWEQENNGEDRTYTSPEEFKAINQIKDELGIIVPNFFYWPEGVQFSDVEIFSDINSFIMLYQKDEERIYLEGYGNGESVSAVKVWEGESSSYRADYGGTTYSITKITNDANQTGYYVSWKTNEVEFVLTGFFSGNEMEKILKNIKN